MVPHVRRPLTAARATIFVVILATLAGCGSGKGGGSSATTAVASAPKSCPATVAQVFSRVVRRVYHEGIASERTQVATRAITTSVPLRQAVERGDAAATRAVAATLVAEGRMTSLLIKSAGRTLANVGEAAVAPLAGTLTNAAGKQIGTYVTSVWSDRGFLAESNSIGEGVVALRRGGRSVGGSFVLPPGRLPAEGSIVLGHVRYQYASFGAKTYPRGRPLRVYLLRTVASTAPLCGSNGEDTTVNTLSRVARLIYVGEAGGRTLPQVRRVQSNAPLLEAVARRDPAAAKVAVEQLLNQHIVRLRVLAAGKLLTDVGGPYVLAPVSAPLRLGGRTIGSFVLSIQDDEGYLRLTGRLAGLKVLMYMNLNSAQPTLVKNSLGPEPGAVPDSGTYRYRGSSYRVYTLHQTAFPSGPLTIHVLIPIPYS